MEELEARVRERVNADPAAFADRVEREAADLKSAVREGTFDNPQAIVGLEWELYGVERDSHALTRIPRDLLELIGFEWELGLHNAELGTNPQPLNRHGLAAQGAELRANLRIGEIKARMEGIRLVSDGMWTIPPKGETGLEYLRDGVEIEGLRVASNMSESPRFHTMSNSEYDPALRAEAPHASVSGDTVLPASLTTSIQPHYQVTHAPYIPEYHRYALRVAAPLLAVGVNSPFFPPSCYDDADPAAVFADCRLENRIHVFEDVLNPKNGRQKVGFPPDVATVEEAIDRVATDEVVVPGEVPDRGRFDDRFKHFRHKHGTYWRWVRPVFDGPTRSAANARIEFRPIPAQPTVADTVSFLATFAGLMESLPTWEHPIDSLAWETARENFYAAASDGVDAEMVWVDADGQRTTDTDAMYEELFDYAVEGLRRRDVPEREAREYVRPLRTRVEERTTPADWKVQRARTHYEEGADLSEAIQGAQHDYIDRQSETMLEGAFPDWLA